MSLCTCMSSQLSYTQTDRCFSQSVHSQLTSQFFSVQYWMSWQFAHGHINPWKHSLKAFVHTDGKMQQQAAPELKALQQEPSWRASDLQVSSGQSVAVQHVGGPSWFAEFTLQRGDASASGLLLRSWLYAGPEVSQACVAALLIDWNSSQLQVCYAPPLHHACTKAVVCVALLDAALSQHDKVTLSKIRGG